MDLDLFSLSTLVLPLAIATVITANYMHVDLNHNEKIIDTRYYQRCEASTENYIKVEILKKNFNMVRTSIVLPIFSLQWKKRASSQSGVVIYLNWSFVLKSVTMYMIIFYAYCLKLLQIQPILKAKMRELD